MDKNKKNILSENELDFIAGGRSRPRPGKPYNPDDWAMPDNYAINGITYQEAVMKMRELGVSNPYAAIDYANQILFPHSGWGNILSQGIEQTTLDMYTYHYHNN